MKVLKPTAEKLYIEDTAKHLEMCGRVCYGSENLIKEDSAMPFLKKLAEAGHWSIFEHAAVDVRDDMPDLDKLSEDDPNLGLIMSRVASGGLRYSDLMRYSSQYNPDNLSGVFQLERFKYLFTFKVTCSRATSHQFVRHRTLSFSERSLRRFKFNNLDSYECVSPFDPATEQYAKWYDATAKSVEAYLDLIKTGANPDDARAVLPLCTATKLIATGDMTWWMHWLELRYDTHASKDMQVLAQQIYNQLPAEVHKAAEKTNLIEQFKKVDEVLSGS